MPDRKKLEEQVEILRGQLEQEPPLSEEKLDALEALIAKFELQLNWNRLRKPQYFRRCESSGHRVRC